jgi:hypothetical protein
VTGLVISFGRLRQKQRFQGRCPLGSKRCDGSVDLVRR